MEDEKIVALLHLVWRQITMAEEALRALYDDPDDKTMQEAVLYYARNVREARLTYRRASAQLVMNLQGKREKS